MCMCMCMCTLLMKFSSISQQSANIRMYIHISHQYHVFRTGQCMTETLLLLNEIYCQRQFTHTYMPILTYRSQPLVTRTRPSNSIHSMALVCPLRCLRWQETNWIHVRSRPVRYFNNIVYHDIFSVIMIQ